MATKKKKLKKQTTVKAPKQHSDGPTATAPASSTT